MDKAEFLDNQLNIHELDFPYFDLFENQSDFQITFCEDSIQISITSLKGNIEISKKEILRLLSGKRIRISDLKYLESHGFAYKNFHEIFLSIEHGGYSFFDDENEWRTKPLRFKINKTQFVVGPSSPLLVMLTEPIFQERKTWHDFHRFSSMRIISNDYIDYKTEFTKGLYYLNSFYLKKLNFTATILNLELTDEDPLGLIYEDNELEDIFSIATRSRNISKKDFQNIEPLLLYNYSMSLSDESKFIMLYRILEFSLKRARVKKLKKMRHDAMASEEDILKEIDNRNEEKQVVSLLGEIFTPFEKQKIANFSFENNLTDIEDFNKFSIQLYRFRNSVVHAKENELPNTFLPNPFKNQPILEKWIELIDRIAVKCIQKFNHK